MGCGLQPFGFGGGNGGTGSSEFAFDTGVINKLDQGEEGKGKTSATQVSGTRRPTNQPEAYVEIKAPTTVGTRSSVPYVNVLPSYKKRAESAIDRQQIPKEHEKRVREYFESLSGKGK